MRVLSLFSKIRHRHNNVLLYACTMYMYMCTYMYHIYLNSRCRTKPRLSAMVFPQTSLQLVFVTIPTYLNLHVWLLYKLSSRCGWVWLLFEYIYGTFICTYTYIHIIYTHTHTHVYVWRGETIASSPGHSRLFNVARRKGGGPGTRSHVRHITDRQKVQKA